MKKYFMKGTEDELQFGDWIKLDLSREDEGKVIHHHFDCKFLPEMVEMLLENDIIEMVSDEEDDELEDDEDIIQSLIEANEDLEMRIEKLEAEIAKLKEKKSKK